MEQLPGLKNEVHSGPVAVKEDGLASVQGRACQWPGAICRLKTGETGIRKIPSTFPFVVRLGIFTIRGWIFLPYGLFSPRFPVVV
jgi:hypothetical protein